MPPLSVCVPLSFISLFVEHAEDVESKEAKEEADDDKGRPNGVQSSIIIPLAVTVQLHGSAMLCLCNAQGIRSILGLYAHSIKIYLCGDGELLFMGDGERYLLWRGGAGDACVSRGGWVAPLDVHVPLPIISFCPQDDCEDIEGNDEKEEAEEEEGRSNGFQPSMRIPLAVITHGLFQGCVSVMSCLS